MHEAVWERKGFVVVETRSVARPTDDGGDGWLGWLDIGHMRNELVSVCSVSTDWLAPSPARRCEKFEFSVKPVRSSDDLPLELGTSWAVRGRRTCHPSYDVPDIPRVGGGQSEVEKFWRSRSLRGSRSAASPDVLVRAVVMVECASSAHQPTNQGPRSFLARLSASVIGCTCPPTRSVDDHLKSTRH